MSEADYGASLRELFARLDPDGYWLKMYQGYYQFTLDRTLATFSETWPEMGMMQSGSCYLLPPLALPILGKECSLSEGAIVKVEDDSPEPLFPMFYGTVYFVNGDQVDVITPEGEVDSYDSEMVTPKRYFPTLGASDYKSGTGYDHTGKKQTPQLRHVIGGPLNPEWAEWFMGFPTGWTELKHSETP